MTVVLLCIAIVCAVIATVLVYRAESRITEAEEQYREARGRHYRIETALVNVEDFNMATVRNVASQTARIDAIQAALAELTAKHLPVYASHELLTALESKIDALGRQLASVRAGLAAVAVDPESDTETDIVFVEETPQVWQ